MASGDVVLVEDGGGGAGGVAGGKGASWREGRAIVFPWLYENIRGHVDLGFLFLIFLPQVGSLTLCVFMLRTEKVRSIITASQAML
eukprot:g7705.t1